MCRVYIVGVGQDGVDSLGKKALDVIDRASLLCGGQRLLDCFPGAAARKVPIKSNLEDLVGLIKESLETEDIVVLASGDPNFYGIARLLVGEVGKEKVEIIPNLSSVQLAFARIKESWDDAVFTSVHGRSMDEIVGLVSRSRKIAILTDGRNTPAEVARVLLALGIADYRAFVCENLGAEDERVLEEDLAGLVDLEVAPLNVLVLLKHPKAQIETPGESVFTRPSEESVGVRGDCPEMATPDERAQSPYQRPWTPGIEDEEFHQRRPLKGLITKAEARVVSISKLRLREDSIVWDIGAGAGSVSVEAALAAQQGQVYAIERNPVDAGIVRQNVQKFGVHNVDVIEGLAPRALDSLPDPDAVFIGGSAGQLPAILEVVCRRLKPGGSLVANFATIDNLNSAVQGLAGRGFGPEVTLLNVARSKDVANLLRFEALDPVFIVSARKERA